MSLRQLLATSALSGLLAAPIAAQAGGHGTLFVSLSAYAGNEATIAVGQPLPNSNGATAIADGTYPTVFNNLTIDPNFGITSPVKVNAYDTHAAPSGTVDVGPLVQQTDLTGAGIATSFSSKSELGLNLSPDGTAITFMAYEAAPNLVDISNSNTPGFIDPTNTDIQTPTNRAVVQIDITQISSLITPTPSYSGNNGRNAILVPAPNGSGPAEYLMVGNGGNGSSPPPVDIVADTGVQTIAPGAPDGTPSSVVGIAQGSPGAKDGFQYGFAVGQLGYPDDKSGKDDNFRGETIFHDTLYVTKGSGGNGINTVYQVTVPGGGLPTAATAAQATFTILPGLPSDLAANLSESNPTAEYYPFGVFFANATTMYVADEGPGDLSFDPNAGLQKWVFNGSRWNLLYTLQAGLALDTTYQVANYPAQYAPAVVGLRNLTGVVKKGVVTLFASTATTSTLGDPGADPNAIVKIVDRLDAVKLPAEEHFTTVVAPAYGQVMRGVAYAACTSVAECRTPLQ